MTERPDGQEPRENVLGQLREHVARLTSVVAELRAVSEIPNPVQKPAGHPRTTGAPDHE